MEKHRGTGDSNEKGYTIIIAVIIMAVLLIVGVAVLTSAANSLNSVNQRTPGRQAYYVAKSALNVVDESMRGGDLGNYVRDRAYKVLSAIPEPADGKPVTTKDGLSPEVHLSSDALKDFEIRNMKISYEAEMQYRSQESGAVKSLSMDIVVEFTAVFGKEEYKLNAMYQYDGDGVTENGEETETWTTKDVGQ